MSPNPWNRVHASRNFGLTQLSNQSHHLLPVSREDNYDGAVIKLAQKLLKKKATHGWEFVKAKGLKGIKFHFFDNTTDDMLVWSFSVVAESSLDESQVKSFLEKLVYITEPMRESEEWRSGDVLSAQSSFAPILLQKMEQVTSQGKLAMVNQQVNTTKQMMAENIELALAREETLQGLQGRSEELNVMSKQFKKRATQVKKFKMIQNAKHGVIVGGLVVAATAIIVVPPLVALL